MSILQLKAMLLGKVASLPLESPYTRILKQLERIGIVIKNEHNQYSYIPIQGCELLAENNRPDYRQVIFFSDEYERFGFSRVQFDGMFLKGDKVHAKGMQETYTITDVIKMNNNKWYALENADGRKLSARKASDLKAVS